MFVRYFAQCFDTLQLDKWTEKPAFGTPLEEHLKRSGREIAVPIEACVMMLLETGMREEVGLTTSHAMKDGEKKSSVKLMDWCLYFLTSCLSNFVC